MTALTAEALLLAPPPIPEPDGPALRLVPAPASAPPYDDELVDGAPPLGPIPRLRAVPEPIPRAPDDADAWLAASRTPTCALPAAGLFARVLLQGVLEVLAGVRPLKQLQRDTSPELYARLQATCGDPGRDRGAVIRPGGRSVRSLHVQQRPEGVAEICATVLRGSRPTALALRLEGLDGRWRCTELAGV